MTSNNKHIIYKLLFPNNKIYIGQTNNFNRRMSFYKNIPNSYSNKYLYNAIEKYDWKNIKKEILIECGEKLVDYFECSFIDEYNSINRIFGYNLDTGGNKNKIMSAESRLKMRNANLGKCWSEESKLKLSKKLSGKNHPMYGKRHSEETKKRMSKIKIGKYTGEDSPNCGIKRTEEFKFKISEIAKHRKLSEETKLKIKNSLIGRKFSKLHRENLSLANMGKGTKPVNAYDINGNFIKEFDSIILASKELHIQPGYICKVAKGKKKFANGYTFKYKGEI